MRVRKNNWIGLAGMLGMLCAPAFAGVAIKTLRPSDKSPQKIGAYVTWRATATDTGSGPLYFQWSVEAPGASSFAVVRDFNKGTLKSGTWTSPAFDWALTGIEGVYQVQVVIMDFTSNTTATKSQLFRVEPLVTGSTPMVIGTSHPLVALFSAPSCAAGSTMRVSFQQVSMLTPAMTTNAVDCHPPATMTFEIGGMYASTEYQMFAQTFTAGNMVDGPTVTFTTGVPPKSVHADAFTSVQGPGPNTDTVDSMLISSFAATRLGHAPPPDQAVDLKGNLMWYYKDNSAGNIIRRPLQGGTFLSTESGKLFLRQVDLEGNYLRETNIFALSQQLLKRGYMDAAPCSSITKPAKVGDACMGSFHHDDIQTLPGGLTAALVDIEMIFDAGTQGDKSGLPVDIIGDGIVVLDTNWQAVWFFDTFQHDTGGSQLDITRPAVLGETCVVNQGGCPPIKLLGSGIAPQAHDWLHANSIYYWPSPQDGAAGGDLIFSSRHQDWVMKIDYRDGAGTGDILWRLGPCGDFTFNNVNNDAWPWNSHQHDAGMENAGAGPMTLFDNGNTRISANGKSTGCLQGMGCPKGVDCSSRGMALTVDEAAMTVTPVLSQYLYGYSSGGDGSAQLLDDGNYFFLPSIIYGKKGIFAHNIEVFPTPGGVNGTKALDLETNEAYRAWQVPDLYNPPTT
jgi:arylsulfate sulfotransferase